MKILLLGELSGVHKELKNGLERRGHTVVSAHSGDTYRRFDSDVRIYQSARNPKRPRLEWSKEILLQLAAAPKLVGFDVVQVISPKTFHWRLQPYLMPLLLKANAVSVMINTGCSSDYNRFVRTLSYSPCGQCKHYDLKDGACFFERSEERDVELRMYHMVDAIVSTAFEYHAALDTGGFAQKNVGIPLPVDCAAVEFRALPPTGPVRIYYGETRFGFKGGRPIHEALDRIQRDFPGEVEVTITHRLSYAEYLEVLSKAHIVVDQANSYSAGMNALYAMAMGKVVLSGAEPEEARFVGVNPDASGVINIRPDAEMIYQKIAGLVRDRGRLPELGLRAREYVLRYHDTAVVSARYEGLYASLLARVRPMSVVP